MPNQIAEDLIQANEKALEIAGERLELVRGAVDKTTRVEYDLAKGYIDLAHGDVAFMASGEAPVLGDLVARGRENATQVLDLQKSAVRGIASAWSPVIDAVTFNAVSRVRRAFGAATEEPATTPSNSGSTPAKAGKPRNRTGAAS